MKGSEKTRRAGISPEVTPANILRRLSIRPISAKQDQTQFPVNLPPPLFSSHSLLKPSTGAWELIRFRQYNRLSTSSNWMSERAVYIRLLRDGGKIFHRVSDSNQKLG